MEHPIPHVKKIALLLIAVLCTPLLFAGQIEQRLSWQDLPQSLSGQKVKVVQTDDKKVSGKLLRVESTGLVLESKKGSTTVPRASVSRIEMTSRKHTRGRIVGIAVGAAPGIVLTGIANVLRKNEGGSNSGAIVGAAVAIAAAGAVLGYFAGRAVDTDKTTIYILP